MPTFTYNARSAAGAVRTGTVSAPSASLAAQDLRAQGLLVVGLTALADDPTTDAVRSWNPLDWLPPRAVDVEFALMRLAVMLRNGMTLLQALDATGQQAPQTRLREVFVQVAGRVQHGASLGDAMAAHRCFPRLAVQLVRVGEASGTLDEVLERAATTLERTRLLRGDLITTLLYPVGLFIVTMAVTSFMVFVTLPRIALMLRSLGRTMPAMTQALLDISGWLQIWLPWILAGSVAAVGGLIAMWAMPHGRLLLGSVVLRLPVVGHLVRLGETAMFSRTLSSMLAGGMNLVEALRAVEGLIANPRVAHEVRGARARILGGESLAAALDCRRVFQPMLGSMIGVGEACGTLDAVLAEVARFTELEIQRLLRRLSALVGPVTIVLVGSIVGFVYMSFFLALFAAA